VPQKPEENTWIEGGYFIRPSDKHEGLLMMKDVNNEDASWVHISDIPGMIFAILWSGP
jgi:hypothetical protein